MAVVNAFQPDALEANRRGELTDSQRRGFGAQASSNRRSALSMAGVFLAGAVLIGFFASPSAPPVARAVITAVALLVALFVGLRAIVGFDALTRDVREGRVQSVEGAIGKRGSLTTGRSSRQYRLLEVGNQTFRVMRGTYEAAPDAGFVRLYFLPRSRKIVNLERLESAPTDLKTSLGALKHTHSRQEANEIRAQVAGAVDRMSVGFTDPRLHATEEPRDPGPLGELLVGSWSNEMMTVTFRNDGTVTVRMAGHEREGNWSVDVDGRLSSNITGRQEVADASVSGDELTIAQGGQGFRFTRRPN
jgi:hypothetical protein